MTNDNFSITRRSGFTPRFQWIDRGVKPLLRQIALLALAVSASTSLGQSAQANLASATEEFLSGLKLMQGDQNAFTPDTYYAPGGIISVVANGELVFSRPFGYARTNDAHALVDKPADQFDPLLGDPVETDSLFRLGSTSKMFVGLALAICKDRGLVDYDDPVYKYIDALKETDSGKTTLKQLFTHSGGLLPLHKPGLRERDDETTNATMAEIISGAAVMTPDTSKIGSFSYSNTGIIVLAEVVSQVQDLPYESFVKAEILNPLGMKHTYFHTSEIDTRLKTTGYFPNFQPAVDPDLQGYAPVGGMYSNGPDMAKIMGLFQKALSGREHASLPIKAKVIQDLTTVYLQEGPRAMGVSIDIFNHEGQTMIGHNGRINGYASFFTFSKEAEVGLIFMANGGFPLGRTSAPALMDKLLQAINSD